MTGEMDLFAIHACQQIEQKWSAQMGKMTLRVDDLEYVQPELYLQKAPCLKNVSTLIDT